MEQSIKIFVALGTQKFPFTRLVKAINKLIEDGVYRPEDILIQSCVFSVEPKCKSCSVIPQDLFMKYVEAADIVIVHGGVNSIISVMKKGKKLIIVPRLKEYGEHVDNHQLDIATIMEKKYDVMVLRDLSKLDYNIERAKNHTYRSWESHAEELISFVKSII